MKIETAPETQPAQRKTNLWRVMGEDGHPRYVDANTVSAIRPHGTKPGHISIVEYPCGACGARIFFAAGTVEELHASLQECRDEA